MNSRHHVSRIRRRERLDHTEVELELGVENGELTCTDVVAVQSKYKPQSVFKSRSILARESEGRRGCTLLTDDKQKRR
jgi:hypothetical protein